MSQLALFPQAPPIAGLGLRVEMVTPAEEVGLISHIDALDLAPFKFQGWLGKRVTASFGSGYDFDAQRMLPAPPIPAWLLPLRARLADWVGLPADDFVQALCIRYDPGAGIGWHRDRPQYEDVVGLSLGSPAPMRFRRRSETGFQRVTVPLSPRAAYHFNGEVRWGWEHSLAPLAERRWSITFRSLSDKGRAALSRGGEAL